MKKVIGLLMLFILTLPIECEWADNSHIAPSKITGDFMD